MKRIIVLSVLALLVTIPFIIADVDAVPTEGICSTCHVFNPGLEVTAILTACMGNIAGYDIYVSEIWNSPNSGWAAFIGNMLSGQYGNGNSGHFYAADGTTYNIWGASNSPCAICGSNVITITPDCSICTDGDGDYYNAEGGPICGAVDCNDSDPDINPGAEEDCTDGIDNDCDNLIDAADPDAVNCPPTCTDSDGDYYNIEGGDCGAIDCNDNDWTINPGAIENCVGAIDDDCDDLVDCDDSDCVGNPSCPSCVQEICNDGIDNDCDNKIDCADKPDCRKDPACN